MLLPATAAIPGDSSPALGVRRLYISGPSPDGNPKPSRRRMIGGRCLLLSGVFSRGSVGFCCRKQQHLHACHAKDDRYHSFSNVKKRRFSAAAKASIGHVGPVEPNNHSSGQDAESRPCYHPSEDIGESPSDVRGDGEDQEERRLTDAEIARTVIEVNDKATLIFSESIDDEMDEKILWPDLTYLTDEHGGIYIEVNNEDDVLQILTENDNLVQVLIGIDNIEKITEAELSSPADVRLGLEDFMEEELDADDDFEQDMETSDFDDGSDEDYSDSSSEEYADWTNLETMQSSHPVYFARRISEAVSNVQFDWMNQPPTSVVIQGFLRPAFAEDQSTTVQYQSSDVQIDKIAPSDSEGELELADGPHRKYKLYKVEFISIRLASSYGNMSLVKVQDYRQAQPDAIARSVAKIISRLKSGGEKTAQALKSLCFRYKGIHVEEVDLTSIDSLGFDLRVSAGTQIQNLRFSFNTRATSEYSAERQLNDLLFPRVQNKPQGKMQFPRKES